MTCDSCGHTWEIRQAHVIRSERTPEGWQELVQCPRCGCVELIIRPVVDANRD